jgi:hypothetical protein
LRLLPDLLAKQRLATAAMRTLGFLYTLSGVLSLTFTAVPTGCTKDGVYCLTSPGSNSDIIKILMCKDGNTQVMSKCLATETCIDNPTPHCMPKSSPQTPSLVTPKPIPTSTQKITTSHTIIPIVPAFPHVPSTVDDPFTSSTDTTQLAARQTQSPFRILIYPEMSIRGKGTSFDTDRCIRNSEIPWPIRSLVVERYFECMFWDKNDCLEGAGPRRKEGSSQDHKIIGSVEFGFEIKSLRCRAVPG